MPELTPVQEYYKGKTIFITGASGFMGKVLLEKLLYSCHELKEIIMICRPKRGKTPESRLEDMFKLPIFQRIKEERPHVLKKVTIYQGDVTYEMLGLSGENLKHVCDNTNIVFHMAATLKLEGNLKDAIDMNLAGTRRALDVAKQMKNLEAFVHLSTAFCNCDQEVMYEKVYDFPHKPEDLMRLAEWMDLKTLENITPDLLKPHPNTYTYSKRLAELFIRDHYETMPVIIARPSIVSPAAYEPLRGWVDNLNGPTGLMIGCGKGVIRSVLVDENNKSEVIPVDYAINGLIVIPYEFNKGKRPAEVPVYNITNAEHRKMLGGTVIEMSKRINKEYPFNAGLWYPNPTVTTNKLYHQFNVLMFHWLPAYFLDFLMLIFGQKRFMVKIQNKIATGLEVLQFFTLHPWSFKSDNYGALWKNLTPKDKEIFNMNMDPKETEEEYLISCAKGARLFILKEKLEDLPKARLHMKIQYVVDKVCKTLIVVTPAFQEPLPGWVDNLNGPTGVMIGAGKGVIRSMLCNGELKSEVIPVDIAINGLIVIPYYVNQLKERPTHLPIFNLTVHESQKRTWKWVMDKGREYAEKYPFEVGLWYPDGNMTNNKYYHWFCVVMFMWLPAVLVDCLLTLFRQRRFMVRVQKRIATGLEVLQFFTTRAWDFKSNNFRELQKLLTEEEKKIFKINTEDIDDSDYLRSCILGGRQYVVKEPLCTLPKANRFYNFLLTTLYYRFHSTTFSMYVLDRVCKTIICCYFAYWLIKKLGVMDFINDKSCICPILLKSTYYTLSYPWAQHNYHNFINIYFFVNCFVNI
ncbi:putative fatty acyl-CoA reductase [Lucilia cuprina]|nr:putative fatty acyl-CoA reductase [Lucilia cuprina]